MHLRKGPEPELLN